MTLKTLYKSASSMPFSRVLVRLMLLIDKVDALSFQSISDQQRNTTCCAAFTVLAIIQRSTVSVRLMIPLSIYLFLSTSDQARLPA
jgi:hypothetical protein